MLNWGGVGLRGSLGKVRSLMELIQSHRSNPESRITSEATFSWWTQKVLGTFFDVWKPSWEYPKPDIPFHFGYIFSKRSYLILDINTLRLGVGSLWVLLQSFAWICVTNWPSSTKTWTSQRIQLNPQLSKTSQSNQSRPLSRFLTSISNTYKLNFFLSFNNYQ